MFIKVSAINVEGPPVPIPNTEVKLNGAENTWLATAREDREALTQRVYYERFLQSFVICLSDSF